MRSKALLVSFLSCVSPFSFADEPGIEAVLQAKYIEAVKNIPVLIEQYANSIGCNFDLQEGNVVEYDMDQRGAYVALIHLDNGCSGGNAMSRPVFIVVKPADFQTLRVDASKSAPHQTSQRFPSVIERIIVKNGELWFTGRSYDLSKDANCCPSIRVTGRAKYRKGEWIPVKIKSAHM